MSVAIEVAHAEDMPKWNNETGVLVLGYGNAGSNAAIAAADAGAKVLILEKTPAGGGNVSVSSGGFVVPTNKEDYYNFQKALYELSRSEWDKDLLDLFCEESLHLGDYVSSLAPEGKIGAYGHAGYQNLPGADCVNKMSMRNVPGTKGGDRLFGIFDRAVKARNIPVLVNCPARRLVRRGNEVLGAVSYTHLTLPTN